MTRRKYTNVGTGEPGNCVLAELNESQTIIVRNSKRCRLVWSPTRIKTCAHTGSKYGREASKLYIPSVGMTEKGPLAVRPDFTTNALREVAQIFNDVYGDFENITF